MLARIRVKMDSICLFLRPYAKSSKILFFGGADKSLEQAISAMLLVNEGIIRQLRIQFLP